VCRVATGQRKREWKRSGNWSGKVGENAKLIPYDDTRCNFNVRSKADMSQLNLPHGTEN